MCIKKLKRGVLQKPPLRTGLLYATINNHTSLTLSNLLVTALAILVGNNKTFKMLEKYCKIAQLGGWSLYSLVWYPL
jgi:hypothetical protein